MSARSVSGIRIYICFGVCKCVWVSGCGCVGVGVDMSGCMYVMRNYASTCRQKRNVGARLISDICTYTCMCVCVCVCLCVCV